MCDEAGAIHRESLAVLPTMRASSSGRNGLTDLPSLTVSITEVEPVAVVQQDFEGTVTHLVSQVSVSEGNEEEGFKNDMQISEDEDFKNDMQISEDGEDRQVSEGNMEDDVRQYESAAESGLASDDPLLRREEEGAGARAETGTEGALFHEEPIITDADGAPLMETGEAGAGQSPSSTCWPRAGQYITVSPEGTPEPTVLPQIVPGTVVGYAGRWAPAPPPPPGPPAPTPQWAPQWSHSARYNWSAHPSMSHSHQNQTILSQSHQNTMWSPPTSQGWYHDPHNQVSSTQKQSMEMGVEDGGGWIKNPATNTLRPDRYNTLTYVRGGSQIDLDRWNSERTLPLPAARIGLSLINLKITKVFWV